MDILGKNILIVNFFSIKILDDQIHNKKFPDIQIQLKKNMIIKLNLRKYPDHEINLGEIF